ncbi:hypothetical protein PSAB6_50054 [Paraburkholderia sabiae]|nr:hypothetical protein PSAB6_50054 [Paraburkholderia sabiae]
MEGPLGTESVTGESLTRLMLIKLAEPRHVVATCQPRSRCVDIIDRPKQCLKDERFGNYPINLAAEVVCIFPLQQGDERGLVERRVEEAGLKGIYR